MANLIDTWILKYHRDLIWLLLVLLSIFGAVYLEDKWHNIEIGKQNTQISALNTQYATLLAQKTAADASSASALSLYQEEHNKLLAFLTKKQVLPTSSTAPLAPLPDIPAYKDLTSCNEAVKILQEDNNDCLSTVQSLQTDKKADENLITNLQDTVQKVDTQNTELKKDNTTQTERKKRWRDTALAGWLLFIAKILI